MCVWCVVRVCECVFFVCVCVTSDGSLSGGVCVVWLCGACAFCVIVCGECVCMRVCGECECVSVLVSGM